MDWDILGSCPGVECDEGLIIVSNVRFAKTCYSRRAGKREQVFIARKIEKFLLGESILVDVMVKGDVD